MDITWKPSERQKTFIEVPDSIFEVLYGGAAGGGKTEVLLNFPVVRQFYKSPRFKGILFRRTYPELESEVIQRADAQGLFRGVGGRYNAEKKRWKFPEGGSFQFGHIEYEKDVRKYDSAEYNYVAFDEQTSFTEYQYLYMFSRCRSSDSQLPAICRGGTNPGNVGHGWNRKRFVEPAPQGNVVLIDKLSGLKRMFIPSKAQDNPYLMQNDPQYINRLMGMAEKDRRAKLDGDWYTFGGQAFEDWRENHYPGEPEDAVHVYDDFKIPSWWPKLLAIDWGYTAMCIALWGAIGPDGRLYIYRERTFQKQKISEWAKIVGIESEGEDLRDAVICQSAAQQRGDELTIIQQVELASKLKFRLSGNLKGSRVAGKLLVQDYMRWKQRPRVIPNPTEYSNELAGRILRNSGIEAYHEYLASFQPEEEEKSLPRLKVARSCTELIKAIPLCVYDDKNKEDVAEFDGDDPYDDLRYMVQMCEDRNWERVKHEAAKIERVDTAVQALEKTGDWSSYYNKMRKIEKETIPSSKPVRRLGRRRLAA